MRPLERPRRRWEDDIKKDLKEMRINTGNRVNILLTTTQRNL